MDKRKILFADDDPEIREVVRILLESEGYQVVEAENGEQAASAADDTFDLIILDVMMPGRNGFSACAEIRRKLNTPILFLTARTQDSDKTMGFGAGGDDYLAKPFSYAELAARVKAMIRRYHVYKGKEEDGEESITVKDLVIQKSFNEVMKNSREILLTDLEYRILLLLASNRGKLFTIENIYESVWGEAYFYRTQRIQSILSMYGERGIGLSKSRRISRLGTELTLAAVASALVSLALYMALNTLLFGILDRVLFSEDRMILREQACVERLQAYVTENGLSTNDGKMLDKWASGEKNLLITIYKDGRFRYSNDAKVMVMVPEMNEWEDTSWLYEVKFADGCNLTYRIQKETN